MSNKEFYLYVVLSDRLCSLNISRLSDSKSPEFKVVYKNPIAEFPIGMGHIVVDSKLYLVGGENLSLHGDDDGPSYVYLRPDESEEWANTDVFSFDVLSRSLCKDSSFPRLSTTKTNPIVAILDNKIHVLPTKPLYGCIGEILPDALFEKLDLEERVWKSLSCPPFYKLDDLSVFEDRILCHYAWGHKLVVHLIRCSYIFDAIDDKWESAEALDLPRLSGAAEYKGQLIGMPLYQQCLVAYNLGSSGLPKYLRNLDELEEIFNPPLEESFQGFLTLLDDNGRMCLLQSGFDSFCSWCVRVAVFQVSVSTSTDNPVITTVLEAVQLYDMQRLRFWDPSIYSTFIMCEDLSKHDDNEADASFLNSNLSILDRYLE